MLVACRNGAAIKIPKRKHLAKDRFAFNFSVGQKKTNLIFTNSISQHMGKKLGSTHFKYEVLSSSAHVQV